MARQSTSPVQFSRTIRRDNTVLMSSARAGVVVPVGYIPLLPGDSASGRVGVDVQLKEMPKPPLNAAHANLQAWFVPKSAHPKFPGRDELNHAMTGEKIKSLGQSDRDPPAYFTKFQGGNKATIAGSTMFKVLGLHLHSGRVNSDLIDAFNLVYNFRLAAHSSRLERRKYAFEDVAEATSLPPAFWPSSRLSRVVPDYERALIVGALDLDVAAGEIPIGGTATVGAAAALALQFDVKDGPGTATVVRPAMIRGVGSDVGAPNADAGHLFTTAGAGKDFPAGDQAVTIDGTSLTVDLSSMYADMGGSSIGITLADLDKARTTQAFAKLRTAYAGNDATGFDNDDTLVALLMQGIAVPPDQFKRPWLLDSRRVPIGYAERFATDGASLEQSVTLGRASATLSLNVPLQDVGGVIIITCEVLPERIDERMSDHWVHCEEFDDLPNALRDVQRVEPVDFVFNHRVDAKHSQPNGLYGYEPMNDVWNRDFTRLGGDFYQATPGGGFSENRSTIWQTEIVNPKYSETHFLAPSPFPHSIFSDQSADAFEFVARHAVVISGNTQIGDVLAEFGDDYSAVREAGGGQPGLLPPVPG